MAFKQILSHCYVMHAIWYISSWEDLRTHSNLRGDNLKEIFQIEAAQILSLESIVTLAGMVGCCFIDYDVFPAATNTT